MAGFLLKGKVDEYQAKLDLVQSCIDDMNNLKSEYQSHLNALTDVMDTTDSNFDALEQNALQNIEALDGSIKNAETRREAVQAAISGFESIGENAANMLRQGLETATSSVQAAIKVGQILG